MYLPIEIHELTKFSLEVKDLEAKRKLRYYKEVINPNLEDQKYLSVLTSSKKKINIAKMRTNSHELHSEIGRWVVPKTPWVERICHLYENMNIEDEKHFLLDALRTSTLDLNFIIFVVIPTFLAF